MFRENYRSLRSRAKELFAANPTIRSPYFDADAVLNADGLHHLRYSGRRERSKPEQMLKFRLLPLGLDVIRKAGTVQEYRRIWQPMGEPKSGGMREAKEVKSSQFACPRDDASRARWSSSTVLAPEVTHGALEFSN
jgi:hypothetical protein